MTYRPTRETVDDLIIKFVRGGSQVFTIPGYDGGPMPALTYAVAYVERASIEGTPVVRANSVDEQETITLTIVDRYVIEWRGKGALDAAYMFAAWTFGSAAQEFRAQHHFKQIRAGNVMQASEFINQSNQEDKQFDENTGINIGDLIDVGEVLEASRLELLATYSAQLAVGVDFSDGPILVAVTTDESHSTEEYSFEIVEDM